MSIASNMFYYYVNVDFVLGVIQHSQRFIIVLIIELSMLVHVYHKETYDTKIHYSHQWLIYIIIFSPDLLSSSFIN